MTWCNEGRGHVWYADHEGRVFKGDLCGCWSEQPDGRQGHTPCPAYYQTNDPLGWVSEEEVKGRMLDES